MSTARVDRYIEEAACELGVDPAKVRSRRRTAPVAKARQHVMRRLRDDRFNVMQIGRWLGRHHSMIVHGLRKVAR